VMGSADCTTVCQIQDQINNTVNAINGESYQPYAIQDYHLSYNGQPLQLPETPYPGFETAENQQKETFDQQYGAYAIIFTANNFGGGQQNPKTPLDPDLPGCIQTPFERGNLEARGTCGNELTYESEGVFWNKILRCQVQVRMIDVYYAPHQPYFLIGFKTWATNAGVKSGRNFLFLSDSDAPICIQTDCYNLHFCREQTDCWDNSITGERMFCASACLSLDCPQVGSFKYIGDPDLDDDTIHGFGICQGCMDCVYNDQVYVRTKEAKDTCTNVCQIPGASGFGMCPSCPSFNVAAVAASKGKNATSEDARDVNFNYIKCSEKSDCPTTNGKMFCASACFTAISSTASYYGISEQCYAGLGSGGGFCQPCDPQCIQEQSIFEPNKKCADVCDMDCPSCLPDEQCATDSLGAAGYDRETFLVPVPDESKIPPAHAPDPNKILATTKCKFDAGPYPEAGCEQCYNGCERVSC